VTEVTEEARGPADGGGAPVPEWLDFVFCWFLRAGREASLLGGDWDSLCTSHHPTTRTLDQDRTAPNRKSRMSVKLSMLHLRSRTHRNLRSTLLLLQET
jgi:hypothetical protein